MRNNKVETAMNNLNSKIIELSEEITVEDIHNRTSIKKEQEIYEFAYGILNCANGDDAFTINELIKFEVKKLEL